ncbi:MAG TPA: O-antigen ligase family protein [Steroidobacteraceae bacterium]|nr:O-antigen ligase family protein [Steroidobacteraceae bacterium]
MTGGGTLVSAYQRVAGWYLVALLYVYPYGVSFGDEASIRLSDLFALLAMAVGVGAIILRQSVRVDRTFLAVAGAFVLLELLLPFVGAIGYRRPGDAASALRMAMLWLPMVFLTLLAPPRNSVIFEAKLERVLSVTLWLNFGYALMQIANTLGIVPGALLVTSWLEPWAVDRNYNLIQGLRPAGFFANSTALSVFGIVCLAFFYARYVSGAARRDLVHVLLALGVIVLSTSRTAYAAGAAILFAGWLHLSPGRKGVIALILAAGVAALLVVVEQTVGIDEAFYRFQRLADSGLLEDASLGKRVYQSWPAAFAAAQAYPIGTLVQATRALPVIDSGYLNYYLQGRWIFVAALAVLLAGLWWIGLRAFFGPTTRRLGLLVLFLSIYLTAAMVVSNPLRSPLMIAFIVFALWRIRFEQQGMRVELRPAATAAA